MSILFGLLSSLLWGVADLFGGLSGRKIGPLRSLVWGDLAALVLLTAWLLATGWTWPEPSWRLLVGCAAAPFFTLGSYCFSRALAEGTLALVVPIATGYGAVAALLAIAAGEPVTALLLGGMALATIGVVLAAVPPREGERGAGRAGIGWALLATVGHGVALWAQGTFLIPEVGSLPAVWLFITTVIVLVPLISRLTGQSLAPPVPGSWATTLGAGLLAVGAAIALALDMATGEIAIVAVLSTLSSVVTGLLGVVFLRERLSRIQWTGVAVIIVGVALINVAR